MAEESRYQMDRGQARSLMAEKPVEEIVRVCNVDAEDHVHLARVGDAGSGLGARGLIVAHEGGRQAKVYLASPELRQFASALLNVADAIDGKTPLVFFDPSAPSGTEPDTYPKPEA
jgi:hypothetical protein